MMGIYLISKITFFSSYSKDLIEPCTEIEFYEGFEKALNLLKEI